MKYIRFFLLGIASTIGTMSFVSRSVTSILELDAHQLNTNAVRGLYHGNVLAFKNKYCTISEVIARQFFVLIITSKITFIDRCGHVAMERVNNNACKWYNLTLEYHTHHVTRKSLYTWKIEELSAQEMPIRLPDCASIVIQLPAEYVDGITSCEREETGIMHFPSIVLKKSLTQKQLDTALDEIALELPDINVYCVPSVQAQQQCGVTCLLNKEERCCSLV